MARTIIVEQEHPKRVDVDRVRTASGATEILVDEPGIGHILQGMEKEEGMFSLTQNYIFGDGESITPDDGKVVYDVLSAAHDK